MYLSSPATQRQADRAKADPGHGGRAATARNRAAAHHRSGATGAASNPAPLASCFAIKGKRTCKRERDTHTETERSFCTNEMHRSVGRKKRLGGQSVSGRCENRLRPVSQSPSPSRVSLLSRSPLFSSRTELGYRVAGGGLRGGKYGILYPRAARQTGL